MTREARMRYDSTVRDRRWDDALCYIWLLVNPESCVAGRPNGPVLIHSFLTRHVRHSWNLRN